MYSHGNFYQQVPPPQVNHTNLQWTQILNEKVREILQLNKKIEELHNSIVEQDKYLDGFEVKIENLEKELKIKIQESKDKETELESIKFGYSKLEGERKTTFISEESVKKENENLRAEFNLIRIYLKYKNQLL